jgi:hypothetical protein
MPSIVLASYLPSARQSAVVRSLVQFQEAKLVYEHIYWDQAGVLVQLDLLDPEIAGPRPRAAPTIARLQ